jgi:heme-degrading monooxygenase HmoA
MHNHTSIFRIDRFAVPAAALAPFMERVRHIQQLLDRQPGCLQNLVLVSSEPTAQFNILTLVEWENTQHMAAARAAVQAEYAAEGFDPQGFMRSLGVQPDMGSFQFEPQA